MKTIIIKPYITEKGLRETSTGRYVLLVDLSATKTQIKDLLEKLYKVNVKSVNISRTQKLTSRSGRSGRYQTDQATKKAIVQLKDKQTLPIFKTK